MNKNKLLVSALALSIMTPVIVAPIESKAETVSTSFKDVPLNHAYYDIINEMRNKYIIKGYEDGTFRPNEKITRKQVAVLLSRALPLRPIRSVKEFKDIPTNHPNYSQIQRVYRAGIVDGSEGNFNPNEPITRVQMAKMLDLAFNLEVKRNSGFPDVPSEHWGAEYVSALHSNGITTGDKGYFKPNEPVTRQHYAVFLKRALDIKSGAPTEPTEPIEPPITIPEKDIAMLKKVKDVVDKNGDLFLDGPKPLSKMAFVYNPIAYNVFLEGMDVIRKNNMTIFTGLEGYGPEFDQISSNILLTSDGYVNPTKRFGRAELIFVPSGEDEAALSYDFRSDKANVVAKEFLKIAYPNDAENVIYRMDEIITGARLEVQKGTFLPIRETVYSGKYKFVIGVRTFYEEMEINVYLKE